MIDDARFRQAMAAFASGVTVVTTTHAGRLVGITVSSFCSLSLNPPLVLICIDKAAASHAAIGAAGMFAVNVLAEGQEYLSRRFATPEANKFLEGTYTLSSTGLPLLNGALVQIECTLQDVLPGGDHTIYTGLVIAASVQEGRPLLYFRSGYHQLG
jgi:flavin reductase (DIM6/NTAB) family NADH-FMN oxidoreductase RutF